MSALSVCIINKDNALRLSKCLGSIKEAFGKHYNDIEIIVTDIGSSDDSVSTARKYTDKVFLFNWKGDYSAARNYCIGKANCDKILSIDSDEYLKFVSDSEYETLISGINHYPYSRGRILMYSSYYENDRRMEYAERISRVFDRRYFHYKGKINEELVINKEYISEPDADTVWDVPLRADHDGYRMTMEERQKIANGRRLYITSVEVEPQNPYLYYQLGKTEYISKNYKESYEYLVCSLSLLSKGAYKKANYLEDDINTLCYSAIKLQKAQDALGILLLYEGLVPELTESADFLFVKGLVLMNCAKFDDAIEVFVSATHLKKAHVIGTNSFMALYNAGVICEVAGKSESARDYYLRCGDYAPALEGLERLKRKDQA